MKYEMIFGDEKLFNIAPEYVEIIRYNSYSRDFLWSDTTTLPHLSFLDLKAIPIVAMRRIINEPKRWTWEDKKNGVLPEVGADVLFGKKGKHDVKIAEFIGTGTIEYVWCLKLRCGSYVFVESEIVSPIETPAEKSQLEEDEFVDVIVSGYNKMPSSISFKAGIRAAYRKLKGGE